MTAQPARTSPEHSPRAARSPRRLRSQLVAALVGSCLLIAGCSAGQRTQTAVAVPVIDAVEANVGALNLRAVTILTPTNGSYAQGSNATLRLFIVNNGTPDHLVSVSSTAAKSATVSENQTSAIQAAVLAKLPAGASPSASTSAAPGYSVALASGQSTPIGLLPTQPQITLVGLNETLYPAMSIPVTFTFANSGSVTFAVSVHLSDGVTNAPTLPVTHESAE